jgi:hypothetical protein
MPQPHLMDVNGKLGMYSFTEGFIPYIPKQNQTQRIKRLGETDPLEAYYYAEEANDHRLMHFFKNICNRRGIEII